MSYHSIKVTLDVHDSRLDIQHYDYPIDEKNAGPEFTCAILRAGSDQTREVSIYLPIGTRLRLERVL